MVPNMQGKELAQMSMNIWMDKENIMEYYSVLKMKKVLSLVKYEWTLKILHWRSMKGLLWKFKHIRNNKGGVYLKL
jgi:hypothetical protein